MRIAVIGTGISGLVASYLLSRDHDITVFESSDRVGGHTHTVNVSIGGCDFAVDTGFIVFNEPHYPLFCELLRRLGVDWQETDMSFSVRCDVTGVQWAGSSFNTVFAQRRHLIRPRFWRMVQDIVRFGREAPRALESEDPQLTVDGFLRASDYGAEFAEHYLIPLGSALWSSPPETFRQFPIRFVIGFLANHCMLQIRGRPTWRTIKGGSHSYIPALVASFRERIQLNSPVTGISPDSSGGVAISVDNERRVFDEVVVACHADQALRLLSHRYEPIGSVLRSFPYVKNEVVLHTDTSVLPRTPRAWASWNYRRERDETTATVTYNMNRLQNLTCSETLCVTLNSSSAIDPARVLRRFEYHHPLATVEAERARAEHSALIRRDRLSFCGAYWGYGFHEDGVRSAAAVARAYGVAFP